MSIPVNCHRVCLWLSRGEEEDPPRFAALLARAHLAWCPHCRRYRSQLRLIAEAARQRRRPRQDAQRMQALQSRLIRRLVAGGRRDY